MWARGQALPPMPGMPFGGRGPPPGMRGPPGGYMPPSGPLPALHRTESAYKVGRGAVWEGEGSSGCSALRRQQAADALLRFACCAASGVRALLAAGLGSLLPTGLTL